jgi:hypothetical protein
LSPTFRLRSETIPRRESGQTVRPCAIQSIVVPSIPAQSFIHPIAVAPTPKDTTSLTPERPESRKIGAPPAGHPNTSCCVQQPPSAASMRRQETSDDILLPRPSVLAKGYHGKPHPVTLANAWPERRQRLSIGWA